MTEEETEVRIGGLALPPALVRAVNSGRWRPPEDDVLVAVFDDEPDGPSFYDLRSMVRQNEGFRTLAADAGDFFAVPGGGLDIEPAAAVLIGDLGADMPIALDYRRSETTPRVLYFGLSGWVEVAPDIETLLTALDR